MTVARCSLKNPYTFTLNTSADISPFDAKSFTAIDKNSKIPYILL